MCNFAKLQFLNDKIVLGSKVWFRKVYQGANWFGVSLTVSWFFCQLSCWLEHFQAMKSFKLRPEVLAEFNIHGTKFFEVPIFHKNMKDFTKKPEYVPTWLVCFCWVKPQCFSKNWQNWTKNYILNVFDNRPFNLHLDFWKSRSASNLRKISGPANLDFFLGLHLEKS